MNEPKAYKVICANGSSYPAKVVERAKGGLRLRWCPPGWQRTRWFNACGSERRERGDSFDGYQPTHKFEVCDE